MVKSEHFIMYVSIDKIAWDMADPDEKCDVREYRFFLASARVASGFFGSKIYAP